MSLQTGKAPIHDAGHLLAQALVLDALTKFMTNVQNTLPQLAGCRLAVERHVHTTIITLKDMADTNRLPILFIAPIPVAIVFGVDDIATAMHISSDQGVCDLLLFTDED